MKISGIICEFDPFHYGHLAIVDQAKKISDGVVCVMSGNFVQRGEPAFFDKWARTRMALSNGADLVLELPLPYACAGAEKFARGGVHILNALGCVDNIIFGSESDDVELSEKIARALLSREFAEKLAALPDNGETFARRREAVISEMLGEDALPLLRQPNDILGIEYIKAMIEEKSGIRPVSFKRIGSGHNEIANGGVMSASQLRELISQGEDVSDSVPEATAKIIHEELTSGRAPCTAEELELAILCKLRAMCKEDFSKLPDIAEGLENRLYDASRTATSVEELCNLIKTKRYTLSRIRRLIMYAFLGVKNDLPELPPYIRILGMTKRGEEIIKSSKASLPFATRPADFQKLGGEALAVYDAEVMADDIYALSSPAVTACGRDFTKPIIKI